MNGVDFGIGDEVNELVGAIFADKCINGFVLREHNGLEAHVHLFGELQVFLNLEFLVATVFFAAQNNCERFGPASFEFVQVVDVQFLEHRGDNARDAGEVSGERVKESLYDNGVFAIGLDVERNDGRTRSIRDVGMALFVIVDESTLSR